MNNSIIFDGTESTVSLDKYTDLKSDGKSIWVVFKQKPLLVRIQDWFLRLFGFKKSKWNHIVMTDDCLYIDKDGSYE